VAELDSLRSYRGYAKVHILGHSWGRSSGSSIIAPIPEHVASLLFGSPALDIPAWERNANRLLKTISDSGQKAAAEAGKTGKFDSPAYQAANDEFWVKYVMRSAPQPVQADLDSTMSQRNEVIYNYMQGPSEFTIVGTLKKYDGTKGLKEVKVPVSFTVGEFDEANPDIVKRQAAMVPGAKVEVLKGSAHLSPWDAPEQNLKVVRDFLRSVDGPKHR
jgi:proline iminopeptidase